MAAGRVTSQRPRTPWVTLCRSQYGYSCEGIRLFAAPRAFAVVVAPFATNRSCSLSRVPELFSAYTGR